MLDKEQVTACRRLLSKVITQAVEDYQAILKDEGLQAARESRVGRWLLETRQDGHGNFPHLCELLELAPERLVSRLNTRGLLREMMAHQAALEARYARYRAMVDGGPALSTE